MTTASEGRYAGEFLVTKCDEGTVSVDAVTVLSGEVLTAGMVVGKVRYGIGRVSIPTITNAQGSSANGTISGVTAGPDVQEGSYILTCTAAATDAGTFSVVCPDGTALPNATVGTAYTSRHLNFTLNDGSTDYAVGDKFTVVVDSTAPTVLGGTGTGTISELLLGPEAKSGNYHLVCIEAITNGGRFQGFDPDGDALGEFLMSAGSGSKTVFSTAQIGFSITDATDFIVGNSFDVAVFNKVTKKVAAWTPAPTTYDGRQTVAGISWDAYDATSADLAGVIVARGPVEVNGAELQWKSGLTTAQQATGKAGLLALGIVSR